MSDILIYGTRGMGRDALAWLNDCGLADDVAGFVTHDAGEVGSTVADLPVIGGLDAAVERRGARVVLAAGNTPKRAAALAFFTSHDVDLMTVIHPSAVIADRVRIGRGSIICPGVVICTDVTVGSGVIVNYGAIIGHDCVVGDGAFIAPGANLAGTVVVGEAAHVGLGACIIQKLTVGARSMVGAGAVVIRSVPPETTVVGNPARSVPGRTGLATSAPPLHGH